MSIGNLAVPAERDARSTRRERGAVESDRSGERVHSTERRRLTADVPLSNL
jgi:hypothetical protein